MVDENHLGGRLQVALMEEASKSRLWAQEIASAFLACDAFVARDGGRLG